MLANIINMTIMALMIIYSSVFSVFWDIPCVFLAILNRSIPCSYIIISIISAIPIYIVLLFILFMNIITTTLIILTTLLSFPFFFYFEFHLPIGV